MEQAQRHLKGAQRIAPVGVQTRALAEAELLQLDIPIAKFMPEELPQDLRRFMKTVLLDSCVGLLGAGVQTAEDPTILERDFQVFRIGFGPILLPKAGRPGLD